VPDGARLPDFGCSWGYGSWQLQRAGFRVTSFEISRPRCRYAREELHLDARDDLAEVAGPFDVFFSAHVLEHVPVVSEVIAMARRLLRPGGIFVAFTPNGSDGHRRRKPEAWMKIWGLVHPNLPDVVFYRKAFAKEQLLLASSPYDTAEISAQWEGTRNGAAALDGDELLAWIPTLVG
jgi:2-polyprenyl-3-methyl-5-hydroxy-6-metoxy-1,4-benzoquinol methylase